MSQIWIDNFVFRLHSQVTVLILFGSSILVMMVQFFGHPINCLVDVSIRLNIKQPLYIYIHKASLLQKEIPSKVMETYCWIHGTFTLPKLVMEKVEFYEL